MMTLRVTKELFTLTGLKEDLRDDALAPRENQVDLRDKDEVTKASEVSEAQTRVVPVLDYRHSLTPAADKTLDIVLLA